MYYILLLAAVKIPLDSASGIQSEIHSRLCQLFAINDPTEASHSSPKNRPLIAYLCNEIEKLTNISEGHKYDRHVRTFYDRNNKLSTLYRESTRTKRRAIKSSTYHCHSSKIEKERSVDERSKSAKIPNHGDQEPRLPEYRGKCETYQRTTGLCYSNANRLDDQLRWY